MATAAVEDRLVFWVLVATFPIYLLGSLYLVGPLVGWLLIALFGLRALHDGSARLHPVAAAWLIGMLVMLFVLIAAHLDRSLGVGQTLKSIAGWAKGWALFALFVLAGAALHVRLQTLARAASWVGVQALVFFALSLVGVAAGVDYLYRSPLAAVGGVSECFDVRLFGWNPETGWPRWQFIAPWSPAAGLYAATMVLLVSQAPASRLRAAGLLGLIVMLVFCQSRLGWIVGVGLLGALIARELLKRQSVWLFSVPLIVCMILLSPSLLDLLQNLISEVENARPDSTRVRNALAEIALQRWLSEAPLLGHGVVEPGPHAVAYMAIGTHQSWYGLLFVKGLVGLLAFLLPILLTFAWLLVRLPLTSSSGIALLLLAVLVCYSFTENLETLTYLVWPALLAIGVCLRDQESRRCVPPTLGMT